jgi:hypothetical protein
LISVGIGSLPLGWALATTEECSVGSLSAVDCESTTDEPTLPLVAIGALVSELLLYFPLYFGLSRVLEALALLLDAAGRPGVG